MKELMVHIEKAVRPLRITQGQRGAIREELLSHLQGIYDEEFAQCGNRTQAINTAIHRFGPAEEISRKLRESMPWYSAVLCRIPWFAPIRTWPESTWRIAWRGWMTGILFWVLVGIPWCAVLVATGHMSAPQATAQWCLMALLGVAFLVPIVGMIGSIHGVYGQSRSLLRAAFFALAGCLGPLAIFVLINLYVKAMLSPIIYGVPFLMPLVFGIASCTRGFAQLVQRDLAHAQRVGEWEQLISEE